MRSLLSWKGISGGESKKPPWLLVYFVGLRVAFSTVYRFPAWKVRVFVKRVDPEAPASLRGGSNSLLLFAALRFGADGVSRTRLPFPHQPISINTHRRMQLLQQWRLLLAHPFPLSRFQIQFAHRLFTEGWITPSNPSNYRVFLGFRLW